MNRSSTQKTQSPHIAGFFVQKVCRRARARNTFVHTFFSTKTTTYARCGRWSLYI